MKIKSIALGAITTLVAVAPVVTMVSCGSGDEQHKVGDIWIAIEDKSVSSLVGEDDHIQDNMNDVELKTDTRYKSIVINQLVVDENTNITHTNLITFGTLIEMWLSGEKESAIKTTDEVIKQIEHLDHTKSYFVHNNGIYSHYLNSMDYDKLVSWDVLHSNWLTLSEMFRKISEIQSTINWDFSSDDANQETIRKLGDIKYLVKDNTVIIDGYSAANDVLDTEIASINELNYFTTYKEVVKTIDNLYNIIALVEMPGIENVLITSDINNDIANASTYANDVQDYLYGQGNIGYLFEILNLQKILKPGGEFKSFNHLYNFYPTVVTDPVSGIENINFPEIDFGEEGSFEFWQNANSYYRSVAYELQPHNYATYEQFQELYETEVNVTLNTPTGARTTIHGKRWEVMEKVAYWIATTNGHLLENVFGTPIMYLNEPVVVSFNDTNENIYAKLNEIISSDYELPVVIVYNEEYHIGNYQQAQNEWITPDYHGWITDIVADAKNHKRYEFVQRADDFLEFYDQSYPSN